MRHMRFFATADHPPYKYGDDISSFLNGTCSADRSTSLIDCVRDASSPALNRSDTFRVIAADNSGCSSSWTMVKGTEVGREWCVGRARGSSMYCHCPRPLSFMFIWCVSSPDFLCLSLPLFSASKTVSTMPLQERGKVQACYDPSA